MEHLFVPAEKLPYGNALKLCWLSKQDHGDSIAGLAMVFKAAMEKASGRGLDCLSDKSLGAMSGSNTIAIKPYLETGSPTFVVDYGADEPQKVIKACASFFATSASKPVSTDRPLPPASTLTPSDSAVESSDASPVQSSYESAADTPDNVASRESSAQPPDPVETRYSATYKHCVKAADGVTQPLRECIDAELAAQTKVINGTYRTLMSSLDSERRSVLLHAEREWIKFRDSKCHSENQTGGTMDAVGFPACVLEMTVRRTIELEQMK
jgi:uncharacterized protein YecT (DUF1311 family)